MKVQRELQLDEKALSNLRDDRQRFLCKAVENYARCLGEGEEHDTWVFRLASLWLGNADVKAVNDIMKVRRTRSATSFSWMKAFLLQPCNSAQSGVQFFLTMYLGCHRFCCHVENVSTGAKNHNGGFSKSLL